MFADVVRFFAEKYFEFQNQDIQNAEYFFELNKKKYILELEDEYISVKVTLKTPTTSIIFNIHRRLEIIEDFMNIVKAELIYKIDRYQFLLDELINPF